MYLILPISEAIERNQEEAQKRGWTVPNALYWNFQYNADETMCALDVADGSGLTDDELTQCVDVLPSDFDIQIPNIL